MTATNTNHGLPQVLVAEDNDSNYILVNALLRRHYTLTRAVDGQVAVELAQKQHFDAILMDVRMPRMDGNEATRHIRQFNPSIPIITLTSNTYESDRRAALSAGANVFLSKPINRQELIATLTSQIKS